MNKNKPLGQSWGRSYGGGMESSTQVLPQQNLRSPRGVHGSGMVGIPSHNTKSGVLPPLVNAPSQKPKDRNNQSILALSSPRDQKARAEKEKMIKQQERDILAEKAAAMIGRAQREHEMVLRKAAEIRAKAELEVRGTEREAAVKAEQERIKKAEAEKKVEEPVDRPQSPEYNPR